MAICAAELVEIDHRHLVVSGVVAAVRRVGEEHHGHPRCRQRGVVAAALAHDQAERRILQARCARDLGDEIDQGLATRLGADGHRVVRQRRQQPRALHVEVDRHDDLIEWHHRVVDERRRAEQPILLGVPECDDDRAARRPGGQPAPIAIVAAVPVALSTAPLQIWSSAVGAAGSRRRRGGRSPRRSARTRRPDRCPG